MIYITGDTHIPIDISKLNTSNFPEQKDMTKNDYVIILGDFGLYWKDDKTFKHWYQWLQDKSFTTLWLDGNHENFDMIQDLPEVDWHGGKVHKDDSIIHLMRGYCYDINNKTFLVAGGAESYDKLYRVVGESWWQQELWDYEEQERIFDTINKCKNNNTKIDYVLSHTCPSCVLVPMFGIFDNHDPVTRILNDVYKEVYNMITTGWYFGHWHQDVKYGIFECLYNKIKRL